MFLHRIPSMPIMKLQYPDLDYLAKIAEPDFMSKWIMRSVADTLPSGFPNQWAVTSTIGGSAYERQLPHKDAFMQPLISWIEEQSLNFVQHFNPDTTWVPRIEKAWFNQYKRQGYVISHDHHPAIAISVVTYLKIEAGTGGNLQFQNPVAQLLKDNPHLDVFKMFDQETIEVPVATGDVVFFPSYLWHNSMPNQSDSDRLVFVTDLPLDHTVEFDSFARTEY